MLPPLRFAAAQRVVLSGFLLLGCLAAKGTLAQTKPGEPNDPKARKTFADAANWERRGDLGAAMDEYRKANKQDGGHCAACLDRAYKLALDIGDFKSAENVARDWIAAAQTDTDRAVDHFRLAVALQREGTADKKEKCFSDSCDEFKTALALAPNFPSAHYGLGISLAHLHQDDAARAQFKQYLDEDDSGSPVHERAERYLERIDLARARMAPPFELTTLAGQRISMDSLAGHVVLIDFWATWCGPCREALPHIRSIARKFQGQPLTILSISLDSDNAKWKDFVEKNEMTWLQYRDGGFSGKMAKLFNVNAIPSTFSIDADGVLEDQHVGDADIEGKLKKMIAHAVEEQSKKPSAPPAAQGSGGD
jgi:thiol-disulfide isomerase/thioredoxin